MNIAAKNDRVSKFRSMARDGVGAFDCCVNGEPMRLTLWNAF